MVLPSSNTRATSSMAYPVSLSSLHHHPNNHHAFFLPSKTNHDNTHKPIESSRISRRSLIFLPVLPSLLYASSSPALDDTNIPSTSAIDTTITDRIFMDFSVCPSYFRSDRTLGAELATCPDSEPLGRVIFGLYGRLLPLTTANFKAACTSAAYRGTLVHKLLQGQFFVAGRQGPRRDRGEVQPPTGLVRNAETIDPKAFELKHARPGTLSLCLGQNDDDDDIKLNPNYHNVEFLVTTGPGPCPELDGQNIVFGTVLEGMDVITSIATIPTYKPAERIRFFNDFAQLIGDERAQTARALWDRPLKTVYISDCGELKVTKPSLSPPSLP
ncbi:peptidyl-prolyl cis-trans isomerase CYP28, chloroplastic [Oryza glaberrima]|uniref:PPIase cyclophilin-type domain-containing protein n=2 Tax=Oryza TaxID=4527 RepID=A0A0D3GYK6_9ORYZ|nr:peptidyl-prolyl cis-trans isomerase CYP28, chloroplastic [Oryza glaberrima]XP_052166420.1 peptidyl-prolyl cis-trans isomerase CYP28, chloroplastic [Oryza glaberrima]